MLIFYSSMVKMLEAYILFVAATSLKPIFHQKKGLRREEFALPDARNVHVQCKDPTPGTQRHLFSTGNWVCVCYPTRRNLHTKNEMYMANARNMHHPMPEIPTCWYFLRQLMQKYYFLRYLSQKYPTPDILRSGGI